VTDNPDKTPCFHPKGEAPCRAPFPFSGQRMQVGREIDPLVSQPELVPDVVAVRVDGLLDTSGARRSPSCLAVPDQVATWISFA